MVLTFFILFAWCFLYKTKAPPFRYGAVALQFLSLRFVCGCRFMDRLLELLELCVNLVSNLFHLLFRELQLGGGEEHVLL